MPQNFLSCDRDQPLLVPPDLRDWLDEDHLAWFVLESVQALDLAEFYADYRSDGHGRAAHDPQMMVSLLLYSYALGERSSRRIESRCREDVAYRVISANQAPDHATIARFRARHEVALSGLFAQVLGLCAEAGLVSTSVLAVDGTKLAAAASERATRSYEEIAKEILAEAGRIDEAEDEIHGDARGDELPPEIATRAGRKGWIRDALRRQEDQRAAQAKPIPRDRAERLELCRERLTSDWRAERQAHRDYEAWRARGINRHGGKNMGPGGPPAEFPERPEGKANLTDPDSKNMKTTRGYLQGFNAQIVTNERQIVIAAEVINAGHDFQSLAPMVESATRELKCAGAKQRPGIVLADAGYWSNEQIDRLRAAGAIPIVAPDADSRAEPRPGRRGGPYEFMRRVLRSPAGSKLYRKRQWMVEGIFGDIKSNRSAERFKRRGLAAVRSEWRLLTATHNLRKLHRHRLATA
ncbi:MAG: transposase [Paracoccaceae bacterium]|nr:transposase [Paracoccaceae bacterium]